MAITLYELVGRDDLRFSPYCWRTRFALAHKGLDFDTVPVRFADKQPIAFSGQERVPVIRDGDRAVADSWAIACYLDEAYPDLPPLFASAAERAMARFVNSWSDLQVNPAFILLVVRDVYDNIDERDREYFLETREKRFGTTLDALHAARDERLPGGARRPRPGACGPRRPALYRGRRAGLRRLRPDGDLPVDPHRQPLPDHRARRSRPRMAGAHARAVRRNGGGYPGARPLSGCGAGRGRGTE